MKKLLLGLFIGLIATAYAAVPITFPINGGTGTNCKPTLGQVLVGNSSGTYNCQATSTLGISGSLSGGTTGWLSYWTSPTTLSAFATGTPGQLLIASSTSASGFGWTATSSLGISGGSGSGNSAWTIGSGLIYNATSTDKVGIGTSTPGYPLTVVGTSSLDSIISGNVNGVIVVDGVRYPKTGAGIQLAVDACLYPNCSVVHVPTGLYTMPSPLTLHSNMTLQGDDSTSTIITSSVNSPTIKTTQVGTTTDIYSNITLRNLNVKHDFAVGSQSHVIWIQNTNGLIIENVQVSHTSTSSTGTPESMWVQYSKNVRVSNNSVHDTRGNGIQINATENFNVVNNTVYNTTDDAIDIDSDFAMEAQLVEDTPSKNGTVVGNTVFGVSGGNGIRVENSQHVSVTGNTVASTTANCILVNTSNDSSTSTINISVVGNNLNNCMDGGVRVDNGTTTPTILTINTLISSNNISNSAYDSGASVRGGIVIGSASTTVVGNNIYNIYKTGEEGAGIIVFKVGNVTIKDNNITSSSAGITLWNGDAVQNYKNIVATNNTFDSVTTNYGGASNIWTTSDVTLLSLKKQGGYFGFGQTGSTDRVQITGNVTPGATDTYGLGSSSLRWLNLFSKNVFATSSVITNATSTNLFSVLLNVSGTSTLATTTTGRLGVNTTIPAQDIDILNASGSVINLWNHNNGSNLATGALIGSIKADNGFLANHLTRATTSSAASIDFLNGDTNWFTGQIVFKTNNTDSTGALATEVARFVPNGNFGLGTTTPGQKLTVSGIVRVAGATAPWIELFSNTGIQSYLGFTTSGSDFFTNGVANSLTLRSSGAIQLGTNASPFLTILSTGLTGIGTTTPSQTLHVTGNTLLQGTGTLNPLTIASSTGTTLFQILANGNVGVGTSSPAQLFTVVSTSSLRDTIPETTNTYSLGASTTRWASLWSGIVNVGTSTWSLGQIGTRFGIFPQAQLGGTEAFSILSDGKVGIGTTSPTDTLSVNGSINVTGSVKVNGTPISGGGSSDGVGTSTADYIISKNGANVVVYDTTANTSTSYSDFDDAMNAIIPTATSTGRSNVAVRSGIYAINSSILYSGNGTVYSTSLNLTGAGGTSTLLVINTPKGFDFSQRAKVNFSNLGIAVGANTNTAFYASTTSGIMASIMDSSFSNIIAVSTTTGHTGYVFDFIGDFRNNYENIRAYQVGNLWRSQNNYSNAQFINGDSNWYGFNFCEINNSSTTASGVCWELKGNNGQVNQVIFGDINGISNDSGASSNDVFLKLTNATRISMPSGGNAEQFATTTQVVSGNGIFLAFTKYVTQTTSATGKAFLDTSSTAYNVNVQCKEVELSAATIVWSDKNTLAGQSNRLSGINGGNCIMTDNGGSVVWATSTRSSIEGIYNNIDGSTSLAAWKVLGDKIVMNFSATMNSYLSYMGGAMRWIMLGTERMTLTDAGNLGLGSTTPVRTLSVVGSQSLSGAFYDSLNSAGGAGECLTSTGSATDWASCGGGGGLSGGSTGLLALWSSATTLAQSLFMDNGTVTGIGATSTSARFNIASTTGNMMWAFGTDGQLSIATTTATTSIETGILGQIKLSALTYSGRDVLATKIASSSSSGIQAALWDKTISRWAPGATNGVMMGSSLTALTTGTALAPTAVNKYTTFRRSRWASVVTTPNQQVGLRTDAQFFRSATSTNSGWFYKATFGIDNYTANDRFFVGLSSCTTACLTGTTTLTNLANTIGFGVEGATSQFVFLTNDGSGAISTTTISGLPTLATNNGYHVYMYNPPTSSIVYWRIDNVNTGAMVAEGNVTTNLPANNTFMTAQVACSNALNAAANACQIGLANLYIEQEK